MFIFHGEVNVKNVKQSVFFYPNLFAVNELCKWTITNHHQYNYHIRQDNFGGSISLVWLHMFIFHGEVNVKNVKNVKKSVFFYPNLFAQKYTFINKPWHITTSIIIILYKIILVVVLVLYDNICLFFMEKLMPKMSKMSNKVYLFYPNLFAVNELCKWTITNHYSTIIISDKIILVVVLVLYDNICLFFMEKLISEMPKMSKMSNKVYFFIPIYLQ